MSADYVTPFAGAAIEVARPLHDAIVGDICPGTGVSETQFYKALDSILTSFGPKNAALLRKRDAIQASIDAWLLERKGAGFDEAEYAAFLASIGYIVRPGGKFSVHTTNVDAEISSTPGPQLVVPVDNARYALNAANARWGSLLDAFYGTDAGPPTDKFPKGPGYQPARGAAVFKQTHAFLDANFPLSGGISWNDVTGISVGGAGSTLALASRSGSCGLKDAAQFVGFVAGSSTADPKSILLVHNGLHVDVLIDRASPVGKDHAAGIKDVVIESAITAIADCEDSVAAVDAEDKTTVYKNWTGLMKGTLSVDFQKGGKKLTRRLNSDRPYTCAKTGKQLVLPGRVVLLVRNVGLHMYTDAVRMRATQSVVPEGIVDAMVTTLAALHDLRAPAGKARNSRKGSMYVVKPKLHGPEEVQFTVDLFSAVEDALGLSRNTVKLGIMDEERRTTVNLGECIRVARERCIFINTGFLDRTGDEIHTSFAYGPVLPKGGIKQAAWRVAYEDWNVDVGIASGLLGRGQIGKGMWAAPDAMANMLKTKVAHPKSGATTAWVPSPTAATLHALHYHMVSVKDVQGRLAAGGLRAKLSDILKPRFSRGRSREVRSPTSSRKMFRASLDTFPAGCSWASGAARCPICRTWASWKIVLRCASHRSCSPTGFTTALCPMTRSWPRLKRWQLSWMGRTRARAATSR